jgi:2-keto-4-pentenoate hydratase/2-oxohepta-3-ene-1,7-dioic acid hydratase in catechol pathway
LYIPPSIISFLREEEETMGASLNHPIHFSLLQNGNIVQSGDSTHMIFSFNKIIANISNYFSLNIGDLIYTGTPSGVGECVTGDLLEGYLEKEKMFDLTIK